MIQTDQITRDSKFTSLENLQIYCGLDTMVTREVHVELGRLFNQSPAIYDFERALQGPYLDMMCRGFRVDETARRQAASGLHNRIGHLQLLLSQMSDAVWGRALNPRSPAQLKDFFYHSPGGLRLPEQWISQKGQRRVSTNREALEKLEVYLHARPIIAAILTIRDIAKQIEVLENEVDHDGRFRTSYNIAGTETGRPSSSENAFGTGGNAQNIAPGLRYVFVADSGYKLGVIDLEQVEARDVGWFCGTLFGDWKFLDNCESGDLHTANARLVWPELPWTGDAKSDRQLANRNYYRDFSYRDMAKRCSHLSNYMGSAWTASRVLKVPSEITMDFQSRYCRGRPEDTRRGFAEIIPAYPAIARFWQWVATELQLNQTLVTPFGRKRQFFARPGDDSTLREAIAFLPQSTTADRMNLGLWRIWKHMPQVQLLAQGFDSVVFQFPESESEDEIIKRALELIRIELTYRGRKYVVPGEAKVGWNWGQQVTQEDQCRAQAEGKRVPRLNPDGLVKWNGKVPDGRKRLVGINRLAM